LKLSPTFIYSFNLRYEFSFDLCHDLIYRIQTTNAAAISMLFQTASTSPAYVSKFGFSIRPAKSSSSITPDFYATNYMLLFVSRLLLVVVPFIPSLYLFLAASLRFINFSTEKFILVDI